MTTVVFLYIRIIPMFCLWQLWSPTCVPANDSSIGRDRTGSGVRVQPASLDGVSVPGRDHQHRFNLGDLRHRYWSVANTYTSDFASVNL